MTVYSTTADGAGAWRIPLPAGLAAGSHVIRRRMVQGGVVGAWRRQTVTLTSDDVARIDAAWALAAAEGYVVGALRQSRVAALLAGGASAALMTYLATAGLAGSVAGADFRLGRYWLPAVGDASVPTDSTEAAFFAQFTAASTTRTLVDSGGSRVSIGAANVPRFDYRTGVRRLLLEDASTNLIIGSAAPATQPVTTTATTYTLALEGTGSITLSGTGTGTLTGTGTGWQNRKSLTFTATAGTLTLTVSGSVENVQLEAKPAASSYIPTTVATVTRAIETFRFPAALEAVMAAGAYSGVVRAAMTTGVPVASALLSAGAGNETNRVMMYITASGHAGLLGAIGGVTTANIAATGAVISAGEAFGAAGAVSAADYAVDDSKGALATSTAAGALPPVTSAYLGRRQDGGAFGNGPYDLMAVWPARLPNASIQSLAVPYA